jgi:hypothetical protein
MAEVRDEIPNRDLGDRGCASCGLLEPLPVRDTLKSICACVVADRPDLPIALAREHAMSVYFVLLVNAATYALAGMVAEAMWRHYKQRRYVISN